MEILIKVVQLVLSLSLLVVIHELGHYMFARIFKVRVDKFYMFFNPRFSLFRAKRFNGKWHVRFFAKNVPELDPETDINTLPEDDWRRYPEHTEWGIGWLPFGGYCSINGMVDETTEEGQLPAEPQPWEYRSQKAWKRMLIISGGVLMNFVGAVVIYIMVLFSYGEIYLPIKDAYLGYDYCRTALDNGFENGDIIETINGEEPETMKDVLQKIVIEGNCNIVVNRNGEQVKILLPKKFSETYLDNNEEAFMQEREPFYIDSVVAEAPAARAGMLAGDSITMLDSVPVAAYSDFVRTMESHKQQTVNITVARGDTSLTLAVTPDTAGKIGVMAAPSYDLFNFVTVDYSFLEAIPAGCKYGWETLVDYVKQFRLVFTKAGAKSLGGFITIGNIFPAEWSWYSFWHITALISIILAVMNILPIPVLDGGYILMLIYEMISGRKPSEKFMNIALNIGMFLLIALVIFANGNDIYKLIFG